MKKVEVQSVCYDQPEELSHFSSSSGSMSAFGVNVTWKSANINDR